MKRKLSLKLPRMNKKRVKGIIVSTEMILLLTAVIMFSVVAFFGISKAILSQATSQKQTLVVIRAEAWKVGNGIAVTMYLHNTGANPVTVARGGIKYSYSSYYFYECERAITGGSGTITIQPGETKVVSFAVGYGLTGQSGTCYYVRNINAGQTIYAYVKVKMGSYYHEVGTAVKVASP